jgi:protein-L-isoaspartate(D-aspartate) O-methyltransferase
MRGALPVVSPGARSNPGAAATAGPRPEAWLNAVREQYEEREQMVRVQIEGRGIEDPRVLEALRTVPRHRFVPERVQHAAHADGPLPISGEQTISQPYIVAFMTEAAQIASTDRCLEIGTGSGYQTAVLAELCREVYSIEYLPEVAALGRSNLEALGVLDRSVYLRVADGYSGWPEQAPFDVILVTAAPARVPRPLLQQLGRGGRLVIPVGTERDQNLETWTRCRAGDDDGAFSREISFGVRFVPFLGAHGQ